MRIGPVLAGVATGAVWSLQARAAGELGTVLGDTLLSVLITFGGGTILIALAAVPSLVRQRGTLLRLRGVPLVLLTGGLIGAAVVWAQTAIVPLLGMTLTTAAILLGSVLTGTVSDATGFGAAGRMRISLPRVLAIAALLGAVVLAAGRFDGIEIDTSILLLVFVAFGIGVSVNVQQTINGRFRMRIGDPVLPTLINFVVGTVIVAAFWLLAPHRAEPADFSAAPLWSFVAPPLAAAVVFATVVLAPKLGALALAATIVSGQFAGALVLDLLVPVPGHSVGAATVAAVVIALMASLLVAIPPRPKAVG